MASQLPLSKGYSRLRPTAGLKVKTSFAEPGKHTNGRANVIRAVDWRKPTPGTSTSMDGSRSTHRSSDENHDSRTSSDMSSPLVIEMDDMNRDSIRYHRPKSEQASWELISSAPALRSHLSQSAIYGLCLNDTTAVQLKNGKPVVLNVNGEDVVMPNRYTFDIRPVNLSDSSSEDSSTGTIGELKRVKDPRILRVRRDVSCNRLGEIPDDIKALLNYDLDSIPEEAPSCPQAEDCSSSTESVIRRKVTPEKMDLKPWMNMDRIAEAPKPSPSTLPEEDKVRFQGLLNRLQKREPQPPVQKATTSTSNVQARDPAILAAKIKEDTVTIRSLRNNEQSQAFIDARNQPQVARFQRSENSRDSGYGTGEHFQPPAAPPNSFAGSIRHVSHGDQEAISDHTKRLNPTAAEFRSTFRTAQMPLFVPKRLVRPPLSNIFDVTGVQQPPPQPVNTPIRPPPGFGPAPSVATGVQTQGPLFPGEPPSDTAKSDPRPATQLLPHPLGLFDPRTSEVRPLPDTLPYLCPPIDILSQPLQSTTPYSAIYPMSTATSNFGTFSTTPFNHCPVPGHPFNLPNINGFGTFPPSGAEMAPPVAPPPPVYNHNNPATSLPRPPLPSVPAPRPTPIFGADGKIIRPHFPVTQKPRDHDPVKQQQYEAYLEWRKANEPGYHIKCKMRQANRIVRQHQMKQGEPVQPSKGEGKAENPAWKSIVEKAKAVVASAAAAAAAEKRARGESVRAELKSKVQESCSDLLGLKAQETSKQDKVDKAVDKKEDQ